VVLSRSLKQALDKMGHLMGRTLLVREEKRRCSQLRIPTMPIADSELMAITIPKDDDRRRSEATLSCCYHAGVIGIRQSLCGSAGE
jgi:hypothetical protein